MCAGNIGACCLPRKSLKAAMRRDLGWGSQIHTKPSLHAVIAAYKAAEARPDLEGNGNEKAKSDCFLTDCCF